MTTATKRRSTQGPPTQLRDSHGAKVCRWIEDHCVHAEGDYYGQPFSLRPWQRAFIYRLYEIEKGHPAWRQALFGMARGNGKTELAAVIAAFELFGTDRKSPVVTVAAASWEQADLVFGALKTMCRESPTLREIAQVYDTEILRLDAPGRAYRVAAVAGTNEGQRPTCVIADELHEWTGAKERVWTVLTSGAAKRADSLTLAITTAGWDRTSLLWRLYDRGKKYGSTDGFLFEWYEMPEGGDIHDPKSVALANPAWGDFLAPGGVMAQIASIPEHEARRYHGNQWTESAALWLPAGAWESRFANVEEKTGVNLAFKGTYSNDSAALVGTTEDGHVFLVGAWESDAELGIDRGSVDAAVREAMATYSPRRLVCNPNGWKTEIQSWEESYGGSVVTFDWDHQTKRRVEACSRFYSAVIAGQLTQDGSPVLARHLAAAMVKETGDGAYIAKGGRESLRKVEAAVAAVMAYDQVGGDMAPMIDWVDL